MEISQFGFILLAVYSFLFGILLGVAYDIIRIQRVLLGVEYRSKKQRINYRDIELPIIKKKAYFEQKAVSKGILNVYIALGDILFVTLCGVITVLVAYAYNSGRVRVIILIGLLVGFLIYYFTIGKLVMKLSELIAFLLRSAVLYVWEIASFPVRKFVEYIGNKKQKTDKKKGAKNDKRKKRSIA